MTSQSLKNKSDLLPNFPSISLWGRTMERIKTKKLAILYGLVQTLSTYMAILVILVCFLYLFGFSVSVASN
jgi:hypothetical protein